MRARTLMVQGTMSSVGKSLMVATLCRIFKQDGWRVAPFKAQNMALNSFATRDGREVGRAQAMQADAAGVDVTVEMNPVLIKPEADSFAQIIVMGKPWARLPAGEYMARRGELWSAVTGALDSLRAQYDLVVIEGAGSPAELNLRRGDLVNMSVAEYADAPVILVGDIDRGGIFAQLLGTLWCLEERERMRVRAFIVNKFRGDARLFDEGVKILEARGGVRVLGVMPFIRDLRIADEDSVALESAVSHQSSAASIDIVVIRLPHISNFDDFDPLRAEPDVSVRFIDHAEDLAQPDLIILPGTKTTIADLQFLRERGIADRIVALARAGVPVLGICGGYQMLGKTIGDPGHVESDMDETDGLGLLPVVTTFAQEKLTERARGRLIADAGLFENARDVEIIGYEIHMGHTNLAKVSEPSQGFPGLPLQRVIMRGENGADDFDGTVSGDGWIAGTYFHGLFNNDALRYALLSNLAARKNVVRATSPMRFDREVTYERLAEIARAHIDMSAINRLLE
ncbi:MAG: cobyric acid synthase [Syntrophales bacterium]|nr:cobyric acid synthase [Syntrophales bacterium]